MCLDLPPLQGRVNDHAGILSAGAVAEIERRLAGLEKSDSTQLVLLTLPTLENEPIEQVAIRVAENWRIGQKGLDNGVILLIAHQEKKIRIEVGRGLEGKLTDLVSGRIIRNDIAPQFKLGNFDAGVLAGVDSIIATVKGEYRPDMKKADIRHGKKGLHPAITLAVFLLVAIVFLGSFSRFLGGIAGAVGLPLVAFLSFPPLGMALLAGLLVAGFVLGLLVVALFGSGGGWRGGGFGGGGFGGFGGGSWGGSDGGFSGGGGDFGGGGASGDW